MGSRSVGRQVRRGGKEGEVLRVLGRKKAMPVYLIPIFYFFYFFFKSE
jgi:hypothetical protein